MRSLRSLGNSYWVALMALALPVAQSHAQECVKSEGLNVCAIGKAQVRQLDETSVQLTNLGDSGQDGASISLGQATDWTAAFETSSKDEAQHTFTAVSDGAPISTTTSSKKGDVREISATFTASGAESTYTLQAYRQGELQGEVRGIPSGQIAARAPIGGLSLVPPLLPDGPRLLQQLLPAGVQLLPLLRDPVPSPHRVPQREQ